jgi:hypothetical protein
MGYSNYWTRTAELPAKPFAAAVKDIKKILSKLNIPLGGRDGTGRPIFRADLISFNGKSPEKCDCGARKKKRPRDAGEAKARQTGEIED